MLVLHLSLKEEPTLKDANNAEYFQFHSLSKKQLAEAEEAYKAQKEAIMRDKNYDKVELVRLKNSDPLPARIFPGKNAHEICGYKDNGCIRPFANIRPLIVTAPNHRLMSCVVQKSMSSVMLATMCYLLRGEAFVKAGRSLLLDLGAFGFCENLNNFWSTKDMLLKLNINDPHDMRFTMVTRDPVDRFLSGFIDRCLRVGDNCFGCARNMTCFLEAELLRAEQYVTADIRESRKPELTMEDMHIFPQNWRCELKEYYNNYDFIRYSSDPSGTLLDDLSRILKEQNVSSSAISYISASLSAGRTSHSTITTKSRMFLEQRLRSSPYLMEQIVRLFYHDYVLLHYPLPDLNSL
ncbi:hypothetical protein Q1695_007447 [Nippostrongylus brasiliensis]|nr:hypothetical protein Q1695_007447 [Nippostrongylus brasiliensis]